VTQVKNCLIYTVRLIF